MHVAINSSGFMHNVPVGNSNKHIFKFSKFQSLLIHLSHYCSLRTITHPVAAHRDLIALPSINIKILIMNCLY